MKDSNLKWTKWMDSQHSVQLRFMSTSHFHAVKGKISVAPWFHQHQTPIMRSAMLLISIWTHQLVGAMEIVSIGEQILMRNVSQINSTLTVFSSGENNSMSPYMSMIT